jgi:hypothetical protein
VFTVIVTGSDMQLAPSVTFFEEVVPGSMERQQETCAVILPACYAGVSQVYSTALGFCGLVLGLVSLHQRHNDSHTSLKTGYILQDIPHDESPADPYPLQIHTLHWRPGLHTCNIGQLQELLLCHTKS